MKKSVIAITVFIVVIIVVVVFVHYREKTKSYFMTFSYDSKMVVEFDKTGSIKSVSVDGNDETNNYAKKSIEECLEEFLNKEFEKQLDIATFLIALHYKKDDLKINVSTKCLEIVTREIAEKELSIIPVVTEM